MELHNIHIALPLEEDRALATGNMYRNLVKFGMWFLRYELNGQTDR